MQCVPWINDISVVHDNLLANVTRKFSKIVILQNKKEKKRNQLTSLQDTLKAFFLGKEQISSRIFGNVCRGA